MHLTSYDIRDYVRAEKAVSKKIAEALEKASPASV